MGLVRPRLVLVSVLFFLVAAQSGYARNVVSPAQQSRWLRWVIPLPKHATIKAKRVVPVGDVAIILRGDPSTLESAGAEELVALFEQKAKVKPATGLPRSLGLASRTRRPCCSQRRIGICSIGPCSSPTTATATVCWTR